MHNILVTQNRALGEEMVQGRAAFPMQLVGYRAEHCFLHTVDAIEAWVFVELAGVAIYLFVILGTVEVHFVGADAYDGA